MQIKAHKYKIAEISQDKNRNHKTVASKTGNNIARTENFEMDVSDANKSKVMQILIHV